MTRDERIEKIMGDIKDINRILDPKGQAWADEEKRKWAALKAIDPPPVITRTCAEGLRMLEGVTV